jgi:hypothetical protein
MSAPIGFFIGISNGYQGIDAIHVELTQELSLDRFHALVAFLNANTQQLVFDINEGKKGTSAYNRVDQKQHELSALLPTENVMLDANFQEYGVDTEYDNLGIPTPIDHPTLVVNFFNPTHTRIIYPDQFETDLYDYLV